MIPRELPQALDPRSVHHPGFDVHVDTHIPLPHVHDRLRLLPLPDADVEMAELEKENTPLRVRRSKKAGILELDALSGALPSPRKGGMPRFRVRAGTDVRFSTFAAVMEEVDALPGTRDAALSPARTPKDRKAARQMLEEEVDEADGEEL